MEIQIHLVYIITIHIDPRKYKLKEATISILGTTGPILASRKLSIMGINYIKKTCIA